MHDAVMLEGCTSLVLVLILCGNAGIPGKNLNSQNYKNKENCGTESLPDEFFTFMPDR